MVAKKVGKTRNADKADDRFGGQQMLVQQGKALAVLGRLSSLLVDRVELDQILQVIAQQVVELMQAKGCSIRAYDPVSRQLDIKAVASLSKDYLAKGPVKLDDSPIDRAALDGQVAYIENMADDARVLYPDEARREGLASGLAIGMLYRGQPVGVIHTYTGVIHEFSQFEIQCLRAIASQAAAAVINAKLHQEALAGERMQRQVRLAGEVQRRMLPAEPPKIAGVQIGCVYEPCFSVGGDFYDFIPLEEDNLGLAIADVAGKGLPASLQMAHLRASLRAFAGMYYEIRAIVKQLNAALCDETLPNEFITLFYSVLDIANRTLTYVNAGHHPPLLLRGKHIKPLNIGGMVVGVDPAVDYRQGVVDLDSGDIVVMYTDGLIDAMNFDSQPFGEDRLAAAILKYRHDDAQLMANNIFWDVRRYVGLATQTDDMTLVVTKID